jgi:hypothetical protein
LAGVIVEKEKPTKNAFMLSERENSGLTEFTMIFHFCDFRMMATPFTISARIKKTILVCERISTRAPRLIRERMITKRAIPMRLNILILLFILSHLSPGQ